MTGRDFVESNIGRTILSDPELTPYLESLKSIIALSFEQGRLYGLMEGRDLAIETIRQMGVNHV